MLDRVSADFLVVGSGIAGLRAAAELAPHGRVLILTKSEPGAGSTGYAQGGIAAAMAADDSPALHAEDTIAAGDGLCDAAAVAVLVGEGPRYVHELMAWGARFDRAGDGTLDLAREGAHSVRRVLHAHDATGREIGRVLWQRLKDHPTISVIDHAIVLQAIAEGGVVAGVRFLDAGGRLVEARAQATLLATGGTGQVYRETTNPSVATGDGVTLAYQVGAQVADLEFVQFHPTVLSVPGAPRYLLSEALRGEGGRLINERGETFMSRHEALGDLAPRDRVARAIVLESERTERPVYLTMAHLPHAWVRERFPAIADLCRRVGLDLATDRLPVSPAAHYAMGGVATDLEGRTSVAGLFAAGEVASTGVHGANRLASNSLLEGLVFGGRAGQAMRAWSRASWPMPMTRVLDDPIPSGEPIVCELSEDAVRELMWKHAGVFRDATGLAEAVGLLDGAFARIARQREKGASFTPQSWRTSSLTTVATLIVRAAVEREESRGGHWRADFPDRDELHWKRRRFDQRLGPAF